MVTNGWASDESLGAAAHRPANCRGADSCAGTGSGHRAAADTARGPAPGAVTPPDPTEQKTACGVGTLSPGTRLELRPSADVMLNYTSAWRFSRGTGQKVAVIDTGVAPTRDYMRWKPAATTCHRQTGWWTATRMEPWLPV